MTLDIRSLPVLSDNYVFLLREPAAGAVAAVDPSVAVPVIETLGTLGWRLTHILNTHHHWDHTGGNLELKERFGCTVVGPAADAARIPGIDVALGEGEVYAFGQEPAHIFDIPGHTRGHIAFYFPESRALFCGDTLFSLGCGRLFEGTPAQMWDSLGKLRRLPADTRVYCGHEYTATNARFALALDPDNAALKARAREVAALRAKNLPTVPSLMETEIAANPFLRADDPALARALEMEAADPVAVFAEVRRRKDRFRG
jgi:hydroxyacylglutathione hydrolase